MGELTRGTKRLGVTLEGYKKRTNDAMVAAAAEGANALLDSEHDALNGLAAGSQAEAVARAAPAEGVSSDASELRQRHPGRIAT